ncbi:hypothetical protein D3C81_1737620 [compost metagenome]
MSRPDRAGGGYEPLCICVYPLTWIDRWVYVSVVLNGRNGKIFGKKGKLSECYNMHIVKQGEFGDISMKQYHQQMEGF